MRMHADEVDIDVELVGALVAGQFPELADLPIVEVRSTGTVNAIYRIGDQLYARLPRVAHWVADLDREWQWLPQLAPRLSLQDSRAGRPGPTLGPVPVPVGHLPLARGRDLCRCGWSTTRPRPPGTWLGSWPSCAASIPPVRRGAGASPYANWTAIPGRSSTRREA